jgi:hypothetical protein
MSKSWLWRRVNFGDPAGVPRHRTAAEIETSNDLSKPIQQLICDVREEAWADGPSAPDKLVQMNIRMVAMMGRVALMQERAERRVLQLTWGILLLTLALVALTIETLFAH